MTKGTLDSDIGWSDFCGSRNGSVTRYPKRDDSTSACAVATGKRAMRYKARFQFSLLVCASDAHSAGETAQATKNVIASLP
jgi:hypothetical protein